MSKLTVQFLDYQVFASYAFCMLRDHCVVTPTDLFSYQFAALDLFGQICDFVVRLLLFIQKLPLSYFKLLYQFVFLLDDSLRLLHAQFHVLALLS